MTAKILLFMTAEAIDRLLVRFCSAVPEAGHSGDCHRVFLDDGHGDQPMKPSIIDQIFRPS